MRFGLFGSIVQIHPRSEGYVLWQEGLIQTSGEEWEVEIHPTPLLRSLFTVMPELEELYPVLVEFVMMFRYPNLPGFVDVRRVERKLRALGITEDGLSGLYDMLSGAAGLRSMW